MSEFRQGESVTERRWRSPDDHPTVLDQPAPPAELLFGPDRRHEGGVLPAPVVGEYDAQASRRDILRAFGEEDEPERPQRRKGVVSVGEVIASERHRALQRSLRQRVQDELLAEPEEPSEVEPVRLVIELPRIHRTVLLFSVTVFVSALAAAITLLSLL